MGHLRYLQNAKALCGRLIVGVLTDEAIVEYKGKPPSIPLQQRMEIIRALECTDAVVEAHTRNVYAEWEKMAFDVVFLGMIGLGMSSGQTGEANWKRNA